MEHGITKQFSLSLPHYAGLPDRLKTSTVVSLSILLLFLCSQPYKVKSLDAITWIGVVGGFLLTLFIMLNVNQLLLPRFIFRKPHQADRSLIQSISIAAVSLLAAGLTVSFISTVRVCSA